MKRWITILITCSLLLTLTNSCRQSFEPPAVKVDYKYLVVEGIISTGTSAPTNIVLSRTRTINDSTTYYPETGAQVYIESEAGNQYALQEITAGSYTSGALNLNSNVKYRLKISTANQQVVMSEYVQAKIAPPIDSITWKQDNDVSIFIHTHDPLNQARYYQWEYVETWEYDSELSSTWGVKNGLAYPIDPSEQTHTCWISANSTDILVASSSKLGSDVISYQPLTVVPNGSVKMLKRYSILARQYALSQEAFDYWALIKKNTENLGTLFDAQPTQLQGNLHDANRPQEPVIGYISAGITTEKRIFINNSELTNWVSTATPPDCYVKTIAQNASNFLIYDYPDPTYTVWYFVTGGIVIAKKECIDCRLQGGSTAKPSFW